ncbi:His/Gly/Thr/Pro-type tRNA ligase C-terminal domain-containing protein [Candidatus Protochlamydia amoebophila]|uniref:Anticodon-binding domain-containing protein n=1 Tax=Protochlamydia amoebophila (strain UWE25) TaxID=264201 RepID=A0A2P9H9M5_PARUW|nr:His/Gly/Thr/Pro-type tRNA ligase C-terminal domain-containing protein [Candidatus Protochlamydia amoebophila]SPJ31692.1 unnamed protein product [Candidatus Protochlamydia amoebophila UWE25]
MPFLHSNKSLRIQRRSVAELLASVVSQLFPGVYLMGGGETSYGFYYDFIFQQKVDNNLVSLIEVHLKTLIKENHPIQALSMMRENAQALFDHHDQPFLAELAGEKEENIVEILQFKQFYGLCSFPLISSTEEIGVVKLLELDFRQEEREGETLVVTRLLGTSFPDNQKLKQFLKLYDSYRKKKDHRQLGSDLNLFSFPEKLTALECVWHPKGNLLLMLLKEWVTKEFSKIGKWEPVNTPYVVNSHFFKFNVDYLPTVEMGTEEYVFSPSPLIQHHYLFKRKKKDSSDLPIHFFEWAKKYVLSTHPLKEGLFNAVGWSGDFSTIFSSDEQLNQEFISSLQFIEQIIRIFGFEARWCLVTSRQKSFKFRQEKAAIDRIEKILSLCTLSYPLQDEHFESDCLEGPRLELRVADEIGREWVISALTLISIHYLKKDKTEKQENEITIPFVIVRQIWESLDRLIALLIERFEGSFPLWLAPEQVRILAVGEGSLSYARQIETRCRSQGLRVGVDFKKSTKLGEKIHLAEKEKVPYLLIIGEQEIKRNAITFRSVEKPGKSESIRLEEFLEQIRQKCVCPTVLDNNYEEERLD